MRLSTLSTAQESANMSSHALKMRSYVEYHCWVVDKNGCIRDGSLTPKELKCSQGDNVKLVYKAWSEIPPFYRHITQIDRFESMDRAELVKELKRYSGEDNKCHVIANLWNKLCDGAIRVGSIGYENPDGSVFWYIGNGKTKCDAKYAKEPPNPAFLENHDLWEAWMSSLD